MSKAAAFSILAVSTAPVPVLAGASFERARIWNGNWRVDWNPATGRQCLQAIASGIRLTLDLAPAQPLVIHGEDGISRKAAGPGKASYYVSFPLLQASGALNGARFTARPGWTMSGSPHR